MAIYLNELVSGSGTTITLRRATGISGSTVFGTGSGNTHNFTGSVYVSGTLEANTYRVNTIDTKEGSTIFGNDSGDIHQFTGSIYVGDDQRIYFGTGNDVSLRYDEADRDALRIDGDVLIDDDKKLKFGNTNDVTMEYDEDGTDQFRIVGLHTTIDNSSAGTFTVTGSTTFVSPLTGSKGMLVPDDIKFFLGTDQDASIEYDEDGTNRLIISGSAAGIEVTGSTRFNGTINTAGAATLNSAVVTQGFTATNEAFEIASGMGGATLSMQGNSTLAGSTVIGNNLAQTHTFTGSILQTGSGGTNRFNDSNRFGSISTHTHQFTGSVYIGDDTKLYFGTGNDVSIEYDEDGQDTLSIAGGDVQIADDKSLFFGDSKEASIKYRETSDNLLVISGSQTGTVVSGSNLYLDSNRGKISLYSYNPGMFGNQNAPIFLTGSAIYTPDESSLVLGDATISNETGILTIDSPGVTINDRNVAPNVTFEVHYTGSKNPTSLTNDTGGGEVVYFGTGSTAAGFLYYLNTDGGWQKTNANATGSYGDTGAGNASLLGVALGALPRTNGMLVKGFFDVNTAFSGAFLKGQAVYVCSGGTDQRGIMSGAAPTRADSYVRIIGYGTDTANVIYFNPDSTWVENS